jgi:hypothetical protein
MSAMRTVECFRVYVRRGHWQLRTVCDTAAEVRAAVAAVERGVSVRIVPGTRQVASWRNAEAPTAARAHRESAFDQMVIRRQAHAYHKSGCNGTELLADPEKGTP